MMKMIAATVAAASLTLLAGPAYAEGRTCTAQPWSATEHDAMQRFGDIIVHNNQWNKDGHDVQQRMTACSSEGWTVTARVGGHDKSVKTFANGHRDFHNWNTGHEPLLSSFTSITSTFATTNPDTGIFNQAYDIWLNGVPGDREVMIWTENRGQVPSGNKVASGLQIDGRAWELWATPDGRYLAFVAETPIRQGRIDIKAMLDHLVERGAVQRDARLGQIGFGTEIVTTNGEELTYAVDSFSIDATSR